MNTCNRIAAVLLAAVVVTFFATAAQAQINVTNDSGCDILLTLTGPGTGGTYLIPSGTGSTQIPASSPTGVLDINGRSRGFFMMPPSPGCTACIPVGAQNAQGYCCVVVCYDSANQKITITSCPEPCE